MYLHVVISVVTPCSPVTNTDVSKEQGASVFSFEIWWARSQPKHCGPEKVDFRLTVSIGHGPCPLVLNAHFPSNRIYNSITVFFTLPIVRYCKNYKTQRFGNWIYFRPQVRVGETRTPLDNPCQINYSYLNTWDQAMSEGDNRKICNKNCGKACTVMELR
jgi:hypothetical protein